MKKVIWLLALLISGLAWCAVEITDLKVTPISPFGKVILDFKVRNIIGEWPLLVTCVEKDSGKEYEAQSLMGNTVLRKTRSQYTLEWDMAADGIRLENKVVTFKVEGWLTYLVIDLSGGTSATSYPVTALAAPPEGGWTDEYKTTKLVLRRIELGSYKMNGSYDVTISKPFYMGVFEVTQKQYQLVMGSNPSSYKGDARPVEQVSWDTIRGSSSTHNWPSVTTVDANSFMGKLRAKTGLSLDLPTEAQWEYACRAGTTTEFYWGDVTVNGHDYAWYFCEYWDCQSVGKLLPNNWGLYDMSGNIGEWCLDWGPWTSGSGYYYLLRGEDPEGPERPVGNAGRVVRGGDIWVDEVDLVASDRDMESLPPDNMWAGFRIVRAMTE